MELNEPTRKIVAAVVVEGPFGVPSIEERDVESTDPAHFAATAERNVLAFSYFTQWSVEGVDGDKPVVLTSKAEQSSLYVIDGQVEVIRLGLLDFLIFRGQPKLTHVTYRDGTCSYTEMAVEVIYTK